MEVRLDNTPAIQLHASRIVYLLPSTNYHSLDAPTTQRSIVHPVVWGCFADDALKEIAGIAMHTRGCFQSMAVTYSSKEVVM